MKDWKMYLLGLFVTISMGMTGVVYSNVTGRIAKVETAQFETDRTAVDAAKQLVKVQTTLEEMKESLNKMDSNQAKLVDRIDALVQNVLRDSRRWNNEMDLFQSRQIGPELKGSK